MFPGTFDPSIASQRFHAVELRVDRLSDNDIARRREFLPGEPIALIYALVRGDVLAVLRSKLVARPGLFVEERV